MTMQPEPQLPKARKRIILAAIALIFGVLTLVSGGKVLFGPQAAQAAAGAYVPFVVWFNFLAGFAYIVGGYAIWIGAAWARPMAGAIFAATVLVGLAFVWHVVNGGAYEMRTVIALLLRAGVWGGIFAALAPKRG